VKSDTVRVVSFIEVMKVWIARLVIIFNVYSFL